MRVPGAVASGKRPPFPKGVFVGTLEKAEPRWNPEMTRRTTSLTFTNITPVDSDSPQVGARKKFENIQISEHTNGKAVELVDITDFNDQNIPFGIQRAATVLTQLALSWGAARQVEGGDVDVEMESFLEGLEGGTFTGREVAFEVAHRTDKKTGVTYDSIARFAAANGATEPAPRGR